MVVSRFCIIKYVSGIRGLYYRCMLVFKGQLLSFARFHNMQIKAANDDYDEILCNHSQETITLTNL